MNKALTFAFCVMLVTRAIAQTSEINIRKGISAHTYKQQITSHYFMEGDSFGGSGLNYVQPLVNFYANNQTKPWNGIDTFNSIAQMFAISGCYKDAIWVNGAGFNYGSESGQKGIKEFAAQYFDRFTFDANAEDWIVEEARKAKITMINETHDYVYSRVYIISLLKRFHQNGYKYLAMETLIKTCDQRKVTQETGYYSNEPVMAELIRYAISLGYKLIPYEAEMTPEMNSIQRDSLQALNLITALKLNNKGKMLVIAGYDHINESIVDTNHFWPMAYYLRKWTGIDPLTIEQTNLIECSSHRTSRIIYNAIDSQKIRHTLCIRKGDPYYQHYISNRGNPDHDLYLIHPKTTYRNGRPTWLSLNGMRKRYVYQLPKIALENGVLVQAYYADEVGDKEGFDNKIPADQTMFDDKEVDLYLKPGQKYLFVCRDLNNNVISKQTTLVTR